MSLDIERAPYQKIVLCLLAAMTVLFAVWTAVSRTNEGVAFQETLLEISEQGSTTIYSGTLYSTPVTITCREENGAINVNFEAPGHYTAVCRVEFPEGTITTDYGKTVPRIRVLRDGEELFSGGYIPDPDSSYPKYFREDGSPEAPISVYTSGADPWHGFAFDAFYIMKFAVGPEISARGSWPVYLIGLVLSVIGGLLTAYPETTFYLNHCFSVRDPEPTDFYYATHKFCSFAYAALMLFVYLWGVFLIE